MIKTCLSCGSEFRFRPSPSKLKTGRGKYCSRSCGTRAQSTRHGMWNTPEYRSWNHMKQRCQNPNEKKFYMYGARGISVAPEWESFEQFYSDMGPRPSGTTIDRIDPDKGYSPDNCRWATIHEQQGHIRTVRHFPFRGHQRTVTEIAAITGVPRPTVLYRVLQGWPDELIATQASSVPARLRKAR